METRLSSQCPCEDGDRSQRNPLSVAAVNGMKVRCNCAALRTTRFTVNLRKPSQQNAASAGHETHCRAIKVRITPSSIRSVRHIMKSRIMYVEQKSGRLTGPARIGRVTFSKTGKTIYYRGRTFQGLKGRGF